MGRDLITQTLVHLSIVYVDVLFDFCEALFDIITLPCLCQFLEAFIVKPFTLSSVWNLELLLLHDQSSHLFLVLVLDPSLLANVVGINSLLLLFFCKLSSL